MNPLLRARAGSMQVHTLSTGLRCETPFHVPDVFGVMIYGTTLLEPTQRCLANGEWKPIATHDGRALACLWLSDFGDSTCGPYQELTVTFLVSRDPMQVRWRNAMTPMATQFTPHVRICEYQLVLNNPHAIAYGRELHGFDKHPGELSIRRGSTIRFAVTQNAVTAVRGHIVQQGLRSQPRVLADTMRAMGVFRATREFTKRVHALHVVTPTTLQQRCSDLFFMGSRPIIQHWDAADRLEFGDAPVGALLRELTFMPTVVQILPDGEGIMPIDVPREE